MSSEVVEAPVVLAPEEIEPEQNGQEEQQEERMDDNEDTQESSSAIEEPKIKFKVHYGRKETFDIEMGPSELVDELKERLFALTGVPVAMQKLVCKGRSLTSGQSLSSAKVGVGAKVLLVGSTVDQIVKANTKPSPDEIKAAQSAVEKKEPLCKQKMHLKVIEKGVPDDAMVGIKNTKERLPQVPIKGMRNKANRPVRLTFKLELDQLWVGTPERTDKIPMNQINDVSSEAIEGFEQYHIMGIKIGTTEQSRVWLYWVPAQYVDSIKHAIMD